MHRLVSACSVIRYPQDAISPTSACSYGIRQTDIDVALKFTFFTTDYLMASSSLITKPSAETNRVGPKTLPVRTMANEHQPQAHRGPEVAEKLDKDTKNKYIKGRSYKASLI